MCLSETPSDVRDTRSGGSERSEHSRIDRTDRLFVQHSVEALGQHVLERLGLSDVADTEPVKAPVEKPSLPDSEQMDQLSDEALAELGKALLS